ncbi:hypothetical protein [Paludisphaera rhizosphaerae]|uniref:hypothetical protein n=2 Tax=Paludisphaera rhizosphaerae TaxID=2711216 RepID=UPI001C6F1FF9|nr:hypothetical protein [Paludisphaera rhizosphaerae]
MLKNHPELWLMRVHYLAAFSLIVLLLSLLGVTAYPVGPSAVLDTDRALQTFFVVASPMAVGWIYLQVRVFNRLPWYRRACDWRILPAYFACLTALLLPPMVISNLLECKITRAVNRDTFLEDSNIINAAANNSNRMAWMNLAIHDEVDYNNGYLKQNSTLASPEEAQSRIVAAAEKHLDRVERDHTPAGVSKPGQRDAGLLLLFFLKKYSTGPYPNSDKVFTTPLLDYRRVGKPEQASRNLELLTKYFNLHKYKYPTRSADYWVAFVFAVTCLAQALYILRAVPTRPRSYFVAVVGGLVLLKQLFASGWFGNKELSLAGDVNPGLISRDLAFLAGSQTPVDSPIYLFAFAATVPFVILATRVRRSGPAIDTAMGLFGGAIPLLPLWGLKLATGLGLVAADRLSVECQDERYLYILGEVVGVVLTFAFAPMLTRLYTRLHALPR